MGPTQGGKAQEPSALFFDSRLFAGSRESLVEEHPQTLCWEPGNSS